MSTSKIYSKVMLSDKLEINFKNINSEIYNTLQKIIKKKVEGICIDEGYVKPDSVNLISYSSGELFSNNVKFDIVYECLVANTVESMTFDCIVKSITKVGIRAEINEAVSPFVIFIARDHHFDNELFSKINENDIINVRVLGQRYELNNKFISVIAELVDINNYKTSKGELENVEDLVGGKGLTKIKLPTKKKSGTNKFKSK
jgi:DNA-directed RNA polymerase subunit E'/Rpb7